MTPLYAGNCSLVAVGWQMGGEQPASSCPLRGMIHRVSGGTVLLVKGQYEAELFSKAGRPRRVGRGWA